MKGWGHAVNNVNNYIYRAVNNVIHYLPHAPTSHIGPHPSFILITAFCTGK
jgi:hypothetical protein